MKHPVVELSDCSACGVCEAVCPEVFCLCDAGYVQVADLTAYPEECVCEAIKNCPEQCIYWQANDFCNPF
ncbi:MAG TPA: ferredoxin, partial [Desulfosalsimonadaceae bacterium]|nr:ferredoxin [Desulfosalsimonadaceae bacterium]